MVRVFALVTSACGPRSDLIPGLGHRGRSDTSLAVFVAPARRTGLGLCGSSQGSGATRGHRAAGSSHQHQRVIKRTVVDGLRVLRVAALVGGIEARPFMGVRAALAVPSTFRVVTAAKTSSAAAL